MTITESRIRQIIRQEARQVLREQGTMQQAGAAIDRAGAANAAALKTAAEQQAAFSTGTLTAAQINTIAEQITTGLLSVDKFRIIQSIPGAQDSLKSAVSASISARNKAVSTQLAGRGQTSPSFSLQTIANVVTEMINNKQISGIVTRLQAQNKGYVEIAGAVVDAIMSRLSTTK